MKTNAFDHPNRQEQAELHRQVLEEVRAMTPKEGFQDLIKSGIYTPNGELAPEYGGPQSTKRKVTQMKMEDFWTTLSPVQRALIIGVADMRYNREHLQVRNIDRLGHIERSAEGGDVGFMPDNLCKHIRKFIEERDNVDVSDILKFLASGE